MNNKHTAVIESDLQVAYIDRVDKINEEYLKYFSVSNEAPLYTSRKSMKDYSKVSDLVTPSKSFNYHF